MAQHRQDGSPRQRTVPLAVVVGAVALALAASALTGTVAMAAARGEPTVREVSVTAQPVPVPTVTVLRNIEPARKDLTDARPGDYAVYRRRVYYFVGWADARHSRAKLAWFADLKVNQVAPASQVVVYGDPPPPYQGT